MAFDTDIILINDALFSANQLGLGPAEGFEITGKADLVRLRWRTERFGWGQEVRVPKS